MSAGGEKMPGLVGIPVYISPFVNSDGLIVMAKDGSVVDAFIALRNEHTQLLKRAEKMEAALREIADHDAHHVGCDGLTLCACTERIARAALTDQEGS